MHYQRLPATEQKIVRCIHGSVCYAVVDLRPDSATYLQHQLFELDSAGGQALYVAPGFASGAQTLVDSSQLFYMMSERYSPGREDGMRYDDPALAISWPIPVTSISDKDANWPPFLSGAALVQR
jgi:dTDP-4-dehydrorhamnose 3,5-epimerase